MNLKVDMKVLHKLPPRHTINGTVFAENMHGEKVLCLNVSWAEYMGSFIMNRKGLFDFNTGEYITEY
jgi:hypothetical protein